MSEPTQSNLDRTSEWGARGASPSPSHDTAPGVSAGDHTAAFTGSEPVSPLAAPKSVTLPCDFGDYELLQEVAHGGMGVVYRARQKSLDRIVALKMILPHMVSTDIAVKRFEQEARSAAQLEHPNIVPIYEIKELQGRHYFTMAFIEGSTLKARVADHPLSRKEILDLFLPVVEAVAYAHDRGIIHRDLKPDNAIVATDGQLKLTDFGVARRPERDVTHTGVVIGTVHYLSPEQIEGERASVASDLYAIGVTLYELLTGRVPFNGDTIAAVLRAHVQERPTPPSALNPAVNSQLESIVIRALDKNPRGRFVNADTFISALERAAHRRATHGSVNVARAA
jgi:serine/threonine-protein kinase